MSPPAGQRLYGLLPAVYRVRDADLGRPLEALLGVVESERQRLAEDIARLYENWFIETCDEWVVPYIGDLLGVRGLVPVREGAFSQRARVANTVGYRRRKGTAAMLEQLARDVTGWPAKTVEFFQLLAATQYLNHARPNAGGTVSLRDADGLELVGGAFERAAHTVDVRHIDNGRGRYDIPHIGIFLWRLGAYPLTRATARAITPGALYTFSPLGSNSVLFNTPRTERQIDQPAAEVNVPVPLRRRALLDELSARRETLAHGGEPRGAYFDRPAVLQVFIDGQDIPLSPEQIFVCDLSGGPLPLCARGADGLPLFAMQVAVDPLLGRLAFTSDLAPPSKVEVSFTYGFGGDLGGGPYDRRRSPHRPGEPIEDLPDTVARPDALDLLIRVPADAASIQDAVNAWDPAVNARAVIQIEDSRTYEQSVTIAKGGGTLVLQAANQRRPTVIGDLIVPDSGVATLVLSGLLIAGSIQARGRLGELTIAHCTLVPGRTLDPGGAPPEPIAASVVVDPSNDELRLEVSRSIVGPLRLPPDIAGIRVRDSVIDAPATGAGWDRVPAIAASDDPTRAGPATTLERVTIFGPIHVRELTLASDVIFTDPVTAERRQAGCVRFSYVPDASSTPRRFRCQPDLALDEALDAADARTPPASAEERQRIDRDIRARVAPAFNSVRYGRPAYAQLAGGCAAEIRTGGDDEGEMGAFNFLQQTQRLGNLRTSLDEYLRLGLEAGILLAT